VEHIWQKVEELRAQYPVLREDQTPIDVFTFLEVDLALDPIPFDDLCAKYRVEAAIKADFTGIYELAHYFLHRDLPQAANFASLPDFARWTQNYGGRKYTLEQEANEFAGRLLVPEYRLRACFDEYAPQIEAIFPNFMASGQIRDNFAQRIAPRFGVNSQVIAIRLDRDTLWPAS